jgi:hypothetical protein
MSRLFSAQGAVEVSLAIHLANPGWDSTVYASAKRPPFQPGQGKPIILFLSQAGKVSAVVARRRVILTRSYPASHPVYCALTLVARL